MTDPFRDYVARAVRVVAAKAAEQRALAIAVAAEINADIPRLEARAEDEDVTLKCGCGERHPLRDVPSFELCDRCYDAIG